MIVYIPTPITSAEQAEATPEDAVFLLDGTGVASKGRFDPDSGACRVWIAGGDGFHTTETIFAEYQVTYLAPVEAKEETTVPFQGPAGVMHACFGAGSFDTPHARLTTPWERIDGPSPDRRGDCA